RVSGLQIGNIDSLSSTCASAPSSKSDVLLRVNEGNKAVDLVIGQFKVRHSFVSAAIANHRTNLVAVDIRCDQFLSGKFGTGFFAGCISSVTEPAVLTE